MRPHRSLTQLCARRRVGRQIAQRELDAVQVMLKHHRIPKYLIPVSEQFWDIIMYLSLSAYSHFPTPYQPLNQQGVTP